MAEVTTVEDRRAAKKQMLELLNDPNTPEEVKQSLRVLLDPPSKRPNARSEMDQIREMLSAGPVDMNTLYKKFMIGFPEMNVRIRMFLRDNEGDERIWINYREEMVGEGDEAEELPVFFIQAIGDEIPEGWDGYIPKELKDKAEAEKADKLAEKAAAEAAAKLP